MARAPKCDGASFTRLLQIVDRLVALAEPGFGLRPLVEQVGSLVFFEIGPVEHERGLLDGRFRVFFAVFEHGEALHAEEIGQVIERRLLRVEADGLACVGDAVADELGIHRACAQIDAGTAAQVVGDRVAGIFPQHGVHQLDGFGKVTGLVGGLGLRLLLFVFGVRLRGRRLSLSLSAEQGKDLGIGRLRQSERAGQNEQDQD